jgi:large subunit ribosomal protein L9
MDVILLERVGRLGNMGQTVKVKAGYARNYLLPQKKALRATEENKARFERERAVLEAKNAERRKAAHDEASHLEGKSFTIIRQAGESGQLYGSVSPRDIAEAASGAGTKVERGHVQLDHPIKTIGIFPVKIMPHPEVTINVTVNVARSPDEAAAQARGEVLTGPVSERAEIRAAAEAVFEEAARAEEATGEAEKG